MFCTLPFLLIHSLLVMYANDTQLQERLKREGVKTHKERVKELNKYLSSLTEHHDMYVLVLSCTSDRPFFLEGMADDWFLQAENRTRLRSCLSILALFLFVCSQCPVWCLVCWGFSGVLCMVLFVQVCNPPIQIDRDMPTHTGRQTGPRLRQIIGPQCT